MRLYLQWILNLFKMANKKSKIADYPIRVVLPTLESCFSSSKSTMLRNLRLYVSCRFDLLDQFDSVLSDSARCKYYNDIARATAFAYYIAKHGPVKYV